MQREKYLIVNEHFQLQYETAQSCYVLLYPEGMVQLNGPAGEIMALCDGNRHADGIIQTLSERFGEPNIEADVLAFLEEAMRRDWVVYRD